MPVSRVSTTSIVPDWNCSRPLVHRSSVVLPEPDGPTIVTTVPGITARETSFRTWLSPNHLLTSVIVTIGVVEGCSAVVTLASATKCTAVLSRIRRGREAVVCTQYELGAAGVEPLE